jgi:hypothetical protein
VDSEGKGKVMKRYLLTVGLVTLIGFIGIVCEDNDNHHKHHDEEVAQPSPEPEVTPEPTPTETPKTYSKVLTILHTGCNGSPDTYKHYTLINSDSELIVISETGDTFTYEKTSVVVFQEEKKEDEDN